MLVQYAVSTLKVDTRLFTRQLILCHFQVIKFQQPDIKGIILSEGKDLLMKLLKWEAKGGQMLFSWGHHLYWSTKENVSVKKVWTDLQKDSSLIHGTEFCQIWHSVCWKLYFPSWENEYSSSRHVARLLWISLQIFLHFERTLVGIDDRNNRHWWFPDMSEHFMTAVHKIKLACRIILASIRPCKNCGWNVSSALVWPFCLSLLEDPFWSFRVKFSILKWPFCSSVALCPFDLLFWPPVNVTKIFAFFASFTTCQEPLLPHE